MWFDSWQDIYAIVLKALASYALLVIFIRLSGKRSTSRMNNFDWIVTVGVGSIFASMILLDDISFAEGVTALGCLLLMQYALTAATARWSWARALAMAAPRTLYQDGRFLDGAMRGERVSEAELRSAVRERGIASLSQVEAIVMEADAQLAIIQKEAEQPPGELWLDVEGFAAGDRRA